VLDGLRLTLEALGQRVEALAQAAAAAPPALALRELRDGLVTLERGQQHLSTVLTLHGNALTDLDRRFKATSVTLDELTQLRDLIVTLNTSSLDLHARLSRQGEHLQTLEARMENQSGLLGVVRERLEATLASRRRPRLALEVIKGIGPVYAKKLAERETRAARTPEQVTAIMDLPRWRRSDAPGWVSQAQALAAQRSAEPQP